MKRLALVVALLLCAVLTWFFWPRDDGAAPGAERPGGAAARVAQTPGSPAGAGAPRATEPPLERSTLAAALNSPATDIRADLRVVAAVLDAFRTNFPRAGNPVGDNAEITAVLSGRNRLRLALIPPEHPAINRQGELCDRWGTPFFFHAESGTRMEIRSAGPDRKMWTADDVVYQP